MLVAIHLLHLSPLGPGAGWRQAKTTDRPSCAHSRRQYILLIKDSPSQFASTKVSGVLGIFGVSSMSLVNHWVKEVSIYLPTQFNRQLSPSHTALHSAVHPDVRI